MYTNELRAIFSEHGSYVKELAETNCLYYLRFNLLQCFDLYEQNILEHNY